MAKADAPLMEVLKGQWTSMFGMAGMFTVTIFLATLIQPFYDRDELRAFGATGSTKLGFILIEGVFILIFTAVIIWLAKKNIHSIWNSIRSLDCSVIQPNSNGSPSSSY